MCIPQDIIAVLHPGEQQSTDLSNRAYGFTLRLAQASVSLHTDAKPDKVPTHRHCAWLSTGQTCMSDVQRVRLSRSSCMMRVLSL